MTVNLPLKYHGGKGALNGAHIGNTNTASSVGTLEDIRQQFQDLKDKYESVPTHLLFLRPVWERLKDNFTVKPQINSDWDVVETLEGIPFEVFETYDELRRRAYVLRYDKQNRVKVFLEVT